MSEASRNVIYAKTKLCPYGVKCRGIESCNYAHSKEEQLAPLCRSGTACKFGRNCIFRHPELGHNPPPNEWRNFYARQPVKLASLMKEAEDELASSTPPGLTPPEPTISITFTDVPPSWLSFFVDLSAKYGLAFHIAE